MGRKFGGLGPHLTQSPLGRGLPPYQVASWCMQPFGYNRNGPKIGEGALPHFGERKAGSPSNTKLPVLRPSSISSGILIHAAIWPQQIWAKNWVGDVPLWGGELGPHLTQCAKGQDLPACQVSSWSVQPFGHNARTSQTGQTGQDRQWTDSIGRTVLQMVAQKPGIEWVQALTDILCLVVCCHSNETHAPIANPSNSAQLEGTPYHSPSYNQLRQ